MLKERIPLHFCNPLATLSILSVKSPDCRVQLGIGTKRHFGWITVPSVTERYKINAFNLLVILASLKTDWNIIWLVSKSPCMHEGWLSQTWYRPSPVCFEEGKSMSPSKHLLTTMFIDHLPG